MATVTTRPDETIANGGSTIFGGAASRHAALSDDSDVTGVELATTPAMEIGFAEPSVPAGAVVKSLRWRVRASLDPPRYVVLTWRVSGNDVGSASNPNPDDRSGASSVSWGSPTTFTLTTYPYLPAPVDAEMRLTNENDLLIHEAYLDTIHVAQPTLTVDSPTGVIAETNAPVEWTPTLDSDGGSQTRYEVKVFSDAQYGAAGFDADVATPTLTSGEVASSLSLYALTDPLDDDTYRAYVRVAQTVNSELHWSDWAYGEFSVDAEPPPVPIFTLTAEDDEGRIRIDLDGEDSSTDAFELQRGQEPIRTVDGSGIVGRNYVDNGHFDVDVDGWEETYSSISRDTVTYRD